MPVSFSKAAVALIILSLSALSVGAIGSSVLQASEIARVPLLFVCAFYKAIKAVSGPVAALLVVAMGAQYIYAQDDQQKRAEAKERIKLILVGLLIIVVGGTVVVFILQPPTNWCA